jgi:hypothetical protein
MNRFEAIARVMLCWPGQVDLVRIEAESADNVQILAITMDGTTSFTWNLPVPFDGQIELAQITSLLAGWETECLRAAR